MSVIELVNTKVQLQRFEGKGGWTYAPLPSVLPDKKNTFGWVKVNGFIDDYEISGQHLMPLGNGTLFLAVKADIRKAIRKQAGDTVLIRLYVENADPDIPPDIQTALKKHPPAGKFLARLATHNRQTYINYVNAASNDMERKQRLDYIIEELCSERIMRP
jgi:hypothetical protein